MSSLFKFLSVGKKKENNAELLQQLSINNRHTPDAWELELQQFQLVFVPDELKKGNPENILVENQYSSKYGTAFTQELFVMATKELGKRSYPIFMRSSPDLTGSLSRGDTAIVKGELYTAAPHLLFLLDSYKNNGVEFQRKKVHLSIPYRPVFEVRRNHENVHIRGEWDTFRNVEAWMYEGNPEFWTWSEYLTNPTFKVRSPRKSSDRNAYPYHEFRPLAPVTSACQTVYFGPMHVSQPSDQAQLLSNLRRKWTNEYVNQKFKAFPIP